MKIEIRSDGTARIEGYVNVVGRESRVLRDVSGQFVEIVAPKTFQRALEKTDKVGLMFNHRRDITPVSMDLHEDNIGLRAIVDINDAEIIDKAKAGKLTGWSFGFYVDADTWGERADGMRLRTLTDIDLIEVSILDCTPAYIATSVEMRGENEVLKEVRNVSEDVEVVEHPPLQDMTPPEQTPDMDLLRQQKRKFEFLTSVM